MTCVVQTSLVIGTNIDKALTGFQFDYLVTYTNETTHLRPSSWNMFTYSDGCVSFTHVHILHNSLINIFLVASIQLDSFEKWI